MNHYCPYCWTAQPKRSARAYAENPFCAGCLNERCERVVAGVAHHVDQEAIAKLLELRHLIQHATEADRHKLPEMDRWFEAYMARVSPAERAEFRRAVRRMWPLAATVLIEEAESSDPEVAAGARLALEQMRSIRPGGTN